MLLLFGHFFVPFLSWLSYRRKSTLKPALVISVWIAVSTLLFGEIVRGYPTIMIVMLFLGGVQLMAMGVLGEYLGRMFMENKQRPLYLIKRHFPATSRRADDQTEAMSMSRAY